MEAFVNFEPCKKMEMRRKNRNRGGGQQLVLNNVGVLLVMYFSFTSYGLGERTRP